MSCAGTQHLGTEGRSPVVSSTAAGLGHAHTAAASPETVSLCGLLCGHRCGNIQAHLCTLLNREVHCHQSSPKETRP